MVTIKIKVNRIYYEDFPTPCGEPEVTEVRMAWSRAVVDVIEAAGFVADIEDLHVGFNPKPEIFVYGEDVTCEFAEAEEEDCEGVAAYEAVCKLAISYGRIIAEKAIDAGEEAAQKLSDKFVEESEAHQ